MKNTAAIAHSVTLPGPECAAAGIHRVPTMQVMVNSVMSRRPSSRFSAGSGMRAARGPQLGVELDPDTAQAFVEELRLAAQPHADVALQAKVGAGHDQHALLDADALAKLVAGCSGVVL